MKVLFLLDFIRIDHYDNNGHWKYLQTQNGKTFKQVIESTTSLRREGQRKDYVFDYVYNQIPQPIYNNYGKVIKYEDVKLTEAKPFMEELKARIEEIKPDIIVPTGKLGIKMLLNVTKLGSVRGVPKNVDVGEVSTWVLPTYSIEYTNVNKNSERQVLADMDILERFVQNGEEVFKPKEVKYEFVDNIERVREIFTKEVKQDENDGVDITAWDLETNSLRPDLEGSKALVASLSWKNGQGVTIPLYKSDFEWANGQQDIDEVLSLMKEWLADKKDVKVLHNGRYDINFLMTTEGFTDFESNEDTKVGWYLAVSQEASESLRLTNLAYEATDMGGYDEPLENFKVWFITKLLKELDKEMKEIQKENKKIAKKEYDVKANDYKVWIKENIDFTKDLEEQYTNLKLNPEVITKEHINQNVLEESEEYMNLSDKGKEYTITTAISLINKFREQKNVINEVDGGKFSYDWFPIELMHPYASGDVDVCRRIYCEVLRKLEKQDRPKALRLLKEDYPRLTRTLARIQSNGFHTDLDYMEKNDEAYRKEMEKTHDKMREHWAVLEFEEIRYNLFEKGLEEFENKPPKDRDKELVNYRTKFKDGGWKFSPSSGEHKGEVLYDILGLHLPYDKQYVKDKPFNANIPESELSWSDYKTDKNALKYILTELGITEDTKEFVKLLQYYASLQTKRNSFTKKLPKIVNPQTGNVHGNFNETGTACISGNSLLITDKGIKEIQEVSTNRNEKTFEDIDLSIVNKNDEIEKSNAFYYSGVRDGLQIILEDGTEIITTPNHPLFKNNYYSNTGRKLSKTKQTKKHLSDNSWVRSDELVVGDYIRMSLGSNLYNEKYYALNNEGMEYKINRNAIKYVLPEYMTEDFAEWYGMYTADGTYSTNNGSFGVVLTNSDKEVRDRFQELTKKVFDIEVKEIIHRDRVESIGFSSIGVGRWLVKNFNIQTKALNKSIPKQILESPKTVQQAFLKGLTLDTATEKKKYPSLYYNTVSNKLARQTRTMLMNMGIYCRYSIGKAYSNQYKVNNECYSVQITYDALEKFYNEVGFIKTTRKNRVRYKLDNFPQGRNKREGILRYEGIYLGKIKSIKKVKNIEFFDLHVPKTHSFVANSIVNHNTGRLSSSNP